MMSSPGPFKASYGNEAGDSLFQGCGESVPVADSTLTGDSTSLSCYLPGCGSNLRSNLRLGMADRPRGASYSDSRLGPGCHSTNLPRMVSTPLYEPSDQFSVSTDTHSPENAGSDLSSRSDHSFGLHFSSDTVISRPISAPFNQASFRPMDPLFQPDPFRKLGQTQSTPWPKGQLAPASLRSTYESTKPPFEPVHEATFPRPFGPGRRPPPMLSSGQWEPPQSTQFSPLVPPAIVTSFRSMGLDPLDAGWFDRGAYYDPGLARFENARVNDTGSVFSFNASSKSSPSISNKPRSYETSQ